MSIKSGANPPKEEYELGRNDAAYPPPCLVGKRKPCRPRTRRAKVAPGRREFGDSAKAKAKALASLAERTGFPAVLDINTDNAPCNSLSRRPGNKKDKDVIQISMTEKENNAFPYQDHLPSVSWQGNLKT